MSGEDRPWIGGPTGAFGRSPSGIFHLSLFPLDFGTVAELLPRHAQAVVVLARVAYFAWESEHAEATLSDLARAHGMPHQALIAKDRQQIIALERDDLSLLFKEIHVHNVELWDAPALPEEQLLRDHLTTRAQADRGLGDRRERAALDQLHQAQVYVASHDNAYLLVEARRPAFVRAVFAGSVQRLVVDALRRALDLEYPSDQVVPVPPELVEHVWSAVPEFELRALPPTRAMGRVRLAYDERAPGTLGQQQNFIARGYLDYDCSTGIWSHHRR